MENRAIECKVSQEKEDIDDLRFSNQSNLVCQYQ